MVTLKTRYIVFFMMSAYFFTGSVLLYMLLGGLMKNTLLDFPGRIACTVFTRGCDLRCPYCHNPSLVLGDREQLSEEAFFSFLDRRVGLLDGVAVSGGEPLMQEDTVRFLREIKARGFAVKLDTNGTYPSRLGEILDLGLVDYVAMDIKSSPEKYRSVTGIDCADKVSESIKLLMRGDVEYEFRTTAVHELHDESDISGIAEWIRGAERYYIQCFRDTGDLLEKERRLTPPSITELETFLNVARRAVPNAALRGV